MGKVPESQNTKPGGRSQKARTRRRAEEEGGTAEVSKAEGPAKRDGGSRSKSLTVRKQQAVALMVRGLPVTEVATDLKVNRSTLYRWLADPEVQYQLSERREEFLERTINLQVYAATAAVGRLMELMESENESTALRAAQALAGLPRTYMLADQERRIRRIEDNLEFYFPS